MKSNTWTKKVENAVTQYRKSKNGKIKEQLFERIIKPEILNLACSLSESYGVSDDILTQEVAQRIICALPKYEPGTSRSAHAYFESLGRNSIKWKLSLETPQTKPKKPAKPRKKKEYPKVKRGTGKNVYWTMDHQNAILKYVSSTDNKERNRLYETLIGPALREMIDNIVYTFKFTTLPNIDSLKEECMHTLVTILSKFDETRGSKAFSYFSVIIKNHFIHAVKKNQKKTREEVHIDDEMAHVEQRLLEQHEEMDYNRLRSDSEYNDFLKAEVLSWEGNCVDNNERKVHSAIRQMMENADNIEILNRKAILVYIQELTGLERSTISPILTKTFKGMYEGAKKKWLNDED